MLSPHARALVVLLMTAAPSAAQAERYELGRRLRAFERAWDETTDEAARKRALAILPKATTQFFSLQLGEAGRTLDEARFALMKEPPTDAQKWLASLIAVPETRLVDSGGRAITVEVKAFYKMPGPPPVGVSPFLGVVTPTERVMLDELPVRVAVSFPMPRLFDPLPAPSWEGDWSLRLVCYQGNRSLFLADTSVSRVRGLSGRLADLAAMRKGIRSRAAEWVKSPVGIELATLHDFAAFVAGVADGEVPETDRPIARLLDDAGRVAQLAAAGEPYFTPARPGDFAVSVPTEPKRAVPCRLLVPKGLTPDRRVPQVVALHGAGGSENLFFEGYGNGRVVKECESRGWMLVAPRAGFAAPPVPAIIDRLADRYPVDRKRVFVVGHSMGVGHAVALCQRHPGLFAGAAMLGGGGRVGDAKPFANLPTFVGVGDKDFALNGARSLAKSLAGSPTALKEYPDVEHMLIVRVALPDVFAAWDKLAK